MKLVNRNYEVLCGTGSQNRKNKRVLTPTTSGKVGVSVFQPGSKKATTVEILVPVRRSTARSRRVGKLILTGRQARALYNELRNAYEFGFISN